MGLRRADSGLRRAGWGLRSAGWGFRKAGWGLRKAGWGLRKAWLKGDGNTDVQKLFLCSTFEPHGASWGHTGGLTGPD